MYANTWNSDGQLELKAEFMQDNRIGSPASATDHSCGAFPWPILLRGCVAGVWLLLTTLTAMGGDLLPREKEMFEIHVRPTLVKHCIQCHGETKQEGGLDLRTLESLLEGGDSGPAIVPGKPEESLLMEAVRYESYEMPPEGQLKIGLINGLEQWISAGAPWPAEAVLKPLPLISDEDREWWAFQPLHKPIAPQVRDGQPVRNAIDQFIISRLESEGVEPTPAASPRVLIRRLHYALTGLPPAEQLTEDFVAGRISYEAVIDQLLDSPEYGEQQARYWLDLVRYADSDGYNRDEGRPEAKHYRDYVIRAFNADKPYDQFVKEQLAGDELDPGNKDAILATMYLRHWIYEYNQRDVEGQWAEILSDVTETTADVFLAMGLKCAKCHDHKYDPLLQKDYFRLQAFFAPLQPRAEMPLADLETRTQHYEQQQAWEQATQEIRRQLHELEMPVLMDHTTREGVRKFIPRIQAMVERMESERTPYEHQIATMASRQFDFQPEKLHEWLDEKTEARRQELRAELAKFDHLKPEPLPTVKFVASDVGPVAPPTVILDDPNNTEVEPGFPTILREEPAEITPPPTALQSTGRRTALANWITDPENPLTARVMVNRLWQQHFGRGLVETCSDFGRLGEPPTHPELLDWLAVKFIEEGWSIKQMHRLILNSATWRQQSDRVPEESLAKRDPANLLLWRMNPRRLAAEEIVDSMLVASNELKSGSRAIYRTVKRNKLDPLLGPFDFPDRIRSAGERHQTTTPTQALLLLNNPWPQERAGKVAQEWRRLLDDEFVERAYLRLLGRPADDEERAAAQEFLSAYRTATEPPKPLDLLAALPNGERGLNLDPSKILNIRVPVPGELSPNVLTIEARVLLRSLYPDSSVRTIAQQWTGNQKNPGWSLGVTSTKSAYKPRNLILQLVGNTGKGDVHYEVVPSNMHLELDRLYHVAVAIPLHDLVKTGPTFYVRDLSEGEGDWREVNVRCEKIVRVDPSGPVNLGSRVDHHAWDGILHSFALHDDLLTASQLEKTDNQTLISDLRFIDNQKLGEDVSGQDRHATLEIPELNQRSPAQRARVAFLHALLNSNEYLYVD